MPEWKRHNARENVAFCSVPRPKFAPDKIAIPLAQNLAELLSTGERIIVGDDGRGIVLTGISVVHVCGKIFKDA